MLNIDVREGVAILELNRPARRNALGTELVAELDRAIDRFAVDDTVGALLITGAAPGFCAGSDLKELAGLDAANVARHETATATMCRRLLTFPYPVVAAVEAFAIGGGFLLATSADIVVTGSNTRWHLTEVALGWLPPWGLGPLVRRAGVTRARQLTWGCAPIDGAEAYRLGVADEVAAPGEARTRALMIAHSLAHLPRQAVWATKSVLNDSSSVADPATLDSLATMIFLENCRSEAARATFHKFSQKVEKTP